MTKAERASLRFYLNQVMNGDFHQGIEGLAKLGGMVYPTAKALRGAKRISPVKLAALPDQSFHARFNRRIK